jgi:hypothetical protein
VDELMNDGPARSGEDLPAVLLFVVVGGVVMALGNLRNVGVWLLQVTGNRAEGVVDAMEFVSGENNEPMRRPVVAFTTDRGRRVVGRPALYRKSTTLANGMTVPVRYSAGNPERMVVPGFGFRYREPVFARSARRRRSSCPRCISSCEGGPGSVGLTRRLPG